MSEYTLLVEHELLSTSFLISVIRFNGTSSLLVSMSELLMEITVMLTSISFDLSDFTVIKIDSTSFPYTVGDSFAVIVSSFTVSNELLTVLNFHHPLFLRTFFFFFSSILKHRRTQENFIVNRKVQYINVHLIVKYLKHLNMKA